MAKWHSEHVQTFSSKLDFVLHREEFKRKFGSQGQIKTASVCSTDTKIITGLDSHARSLDCENVCGILNNVSILLETQCSVQNRRKWTHFSKKKKFSKNGKSLQYKYKNYFHIRSSHKVVTLRICVWNFDLFHKSRWKYSFCSKQHIKRQKK